MFFPINAGQPYDPTKGFCENNRAPIAFLTIGSVLTALGVTLLCVVGGPAGSVIGGIICSIGVPMVSYGIFQLIYNRCVYGGPICSPSEDNHRSDGGQPPPVRQRAAHQTDSERRADPEEVRTPLKEDTE